MSGRWRPLPASFDTEVAYLVGVLREFKDRSGLSLATLAARTAYSKSSWERYLNGAALPPRQAVAALAQLVGEPVDRPLALWERAEARWSGRTGDATPTSEPPEAATATATATTGTGHDPGPTRSRPRSRVLIMAVGGSLAVVLLALAPSLGYSPPAGSPARVPVTVGCQGAQCTGQDAYPMACGVDAATFADLQVDGAYLELRISDRCGAAWARVSHATAGDRLQVLDQNGQSQATTVPEASAGQYVASPMISAGRHSQVRACVQRSDGERRCTPWGGNRPVPSSRFAPSSTTPDSNRARLLPERAPYSPRINRNAVFLSLDQSRPNGHNQTRIGSL